MQRQGKLVRLVAVGLSLWLFALPPADVWGQDNAIDNADEQAEAVEVPDAPGAASPDSQEAVELDSVLLTHRVFLPTIQGSKQTASAVETGAETNEVVAAFAQVWVANPCTNVTAAQRGLWDDMPGAGLNNEAGLLWFVTDQTLDEACSYSAAVPNLVTSAATINQLRVRVAVNDSALFSATVYRVIAGVCTPWRSIQTVAASDNSLFTTWTSALPAGSTICSVRINLTDDPDNVITTNTSALIDYIELRNSGSGTFYWQEHFTG